MAIRRIVQIDENKCNGCGECVPACHEGAIEIINGKAKLIADKLCDGLGDCLGECPLGAIQIIEREADEFDEIAVKERLAELNDNSPQKGGCPGSRQQSFSGCPGSQMQSFNKDDKDNSPVNISSELRQWPVQLHLVPPTAPYLQNAELLITATCVPLAYGNFQQSLLKDKAVVVACPKLDNTEPYLNKLVNIIKHNNLKGITLARMEVPCCGGLNMLVKQALTQAGIEVPVKETVIGIRGNVLK